MMRRSVIIVTEHGEGFEVKLTVIDAWTAGGNYRLVNLGAGPYQLQIYDNGEWREESVQYRWSAVTHRIEELKKTLSSLNSDNISNFKPFTFSKEKE
jgi:hypothetical protein